MFASSRTCLRKFERVQFYFLVIENDGRKCVQNFFMNMFAVKFHPQKKNEKLSKKVEPNFFKIWLL